MIGCNVKGGLGNMLFQIAATIDLKNEYETQYSICNLQTHIASLESKYKRSIDVENYKDFFSKFNCFSLKGQIVRFPFIYQKKKIAIPCIVDGYFQSEKYFLNSKKEICDLFSPTEDIKKAINKFKFKNSVAVHVRRGDYLKLKNHHPTQEVEYYINTIREIRKEKQISNIYIFSDDMAWCKKTFLGPEYVFINKPDMTSMFIMSSCENQIIANSSFSWWAAWLNKNPNKIVFAPKKWFGDSIKEDTSDLYCKGWRVR